MHSQSTLPPNLIYCNTSSNSFFISNGDRNIFHNDSPSPASDSENEEQQRHISATLHAARTRSNDSDHLFSPSISIYGSLDRRLDYGATSSNASRSPSPPHDSSSYHLHRTGDDARLPVFSSVRADSKDVYRVPFQLPDPLVDTEPAMRKYRLLKRFSIAFCILYLLAIVVLSPLLMTDADDQATLTVSLRNHRPTLSSVYQRYPLRLVCPAIVFLILMLLAAECAIVRFKRLIDYNRPGALLLLYTIDVLVAALTLKYLACSIIGYHRIGREYEACHGATNGPRRDYFDPTVHVSSDRAPAASPSTSAEQLSICLDSDSQILFYIRILLTVMMPLLILSFLALFLHTKHKQLAEQPHMSIRDWLSSMLRLRRQYRPINL